MKDKPHKICSYGIYFVKFREIAGFVLHNAHTHSGSKSENAGKLRMLNSAWTESQESEFCTLLLSFKCQKKLYRLHWSLTHSFSFHASMLLLKPIRDDSISWPRGIHSFSFKTQGLVTLKIRHIVHIDVEKYEGIK